MMDHITEYLGAYMFLVLAITLFTGIPVGMAVGGIAMVFGFLGIYFDIVSIHEFFNVPNRMWGGDGASGAIQNPVLVAIPCFIFMGTMLERSRVAYDLLHILQIMLKRVPGGLALSVTVMGTILAATTGIIGASVVMITLLALPTMLDRGYSTPLATGTIAASATLGILIPPSIMLVLMASLMAISVGNLFLGAILPGFLLAGLYFVYILVVCAFKPEWAPPLPDDMIALEDTNYRNLTFFLGVTVLVISLARLLMVGGLGEIANWNLVAFFIIFAWSMVMGKIEGDSYFGSILRGFVPPVFLITMVLGSIFGGWATPTEASGVGAFGALTLAWINRTLTFHVLRDVVYRTALTTSMIFFIFLAATAFSYFFRALYGEDLIIDFIEHMDLGPWMLIGILMLVIFLLGFFFDFLEITLIILPVFTPVIREIAPAFQEHLGLGAGVPTSVIELQVLYWFAILVAVNLQTSFLTPPFGFALFYLKGVAPRGVKIEHIYKGIIPFVILQLIGLYIVFQFPQLALWLPNQLLN